MDDDNRTRLLADVEAFCEEIRPAEELCYLEHRFNEQAIGLAKKYNLLGMPVGEEYGGRRADARTYAQALARIGREGSGLRTLFSAHSSIGQYPIARFGTEEQKQRVPAGVGPRREDHGVRPDRARGRLQSAGDEDHLSPRAAINSCSTASST